MRAVDLLASRLERRRLPGAGMRALLRFTRQGGAYHAAALTYYAILSLFPAAGLIYALLGLVGADSAIGDVARTLERHSVDPQFVDALEHTVRTAVDQRYGDAVAAFAISAAIALFVAGRWLRAIDRALDAVLERERLLGGKRLVARTRDTAVLVLLVSAALVIGFAGRALSAQLVGDALPAARASVTVAAATAVAVAAFAYLYAFVPSPPRLPAAAILAGALLAAAIWLVGTVGFFVFVDRWPGYDTNYGPFAAPVAAMVWLFLTDACVLLGAAFGVEWVRPAT